MQSLLESEVNATVDVIRHMLSTFSIPDLLPSAILVSKTGADIKREVIHYQIRNLSEVMIDVGEKSRLTSQGDFLLALLITPLNSEHHPHIYILGTSVCLDYAAIFRTSSPNGYLRPCASTERGPVINDGRGLAEYFWIGRTGKHFPNERSYSHDR